LRSQQSIESATGGGSQNAAGVPGALSNQPPVPATAPIVNPASAVTAGAANLTAGSSRHKEATLNYEVDRTIRYTKLPVGSIKRISAAVVINNRSVTDKNGKVSSKPLSDSEREQISSLVKEAIGFDSNRGDTLNVLNSAFNEPKEIPVTELPLWKQPEMIALAKDVLKYLLILGIFLYLLLGIIRPAFKNSAKTHAAIGQAETETLTKLEQLKAEKLAEETQRIYENSLQGLKQMAQQDPKMVASVVKDWVSKDE
jgi:flagellar M-ring protein FliF